MLSRGNSEHEGVEAKKHRIYLRKQQIFQNSRLNEEKVVEDKV